MRYKNLMMTWSNKRKLTRWRFKNTRLCSRPMPTNLSNWPEKKSKSYRISMTSKSRILRTYRRILIFCKKVSIIKTRQIKSYLQQIFYRPRKFKLKMNRSQLSKFSRRGFWISTKNLRFCLRI